jgi:circadian clock protein KaiB
MSAAENEFALPLLHLLLIVAGSGARSRRAIENLQRFCDDYLIGKVDIKIIDMCQEPELAVTYQVVATPMLLKLVPPPIRRIVGDLSQTDRVIDSLELDTMH